MIRVDKETCLGCAACTMVCPDVFRMADDGKAEAYTQDNIECAKKAAASCPVQAISVE